MLVSHLKPFLEKTGKGLADWAGQTGEAAHFKVNVEMSRFRRDLSNPHCGKKTLAGVTRFNSKRL